MAAMPLPAEMTVIEIAAPGGPDVLRPARRPLPAVGRDEVLIRVHAAGVNRPDVLQRLGKYPPPPGASDLPGLEVAGEVVARGEAVDSWQLGDAVCALVAGGGYAEYCAAPAAQCLPIPRGWTLVEAASIPETHFTVWANVFERGGLRRGETLLAHGGSSGIGTTAIQFGRAAGATVLATAGSVEKCAACERLGARRAINYRDEDFVQAVKDVTSGRGVDVILDMVGGDYVPRNIECLAVEGRLVQIAFLKGPKAEIDLSQVMRRRLIVTGSTLRPRSVAEKAALAQALRQHVWPWLEQKTVGPVVHRVFAMQDAAEAHRVMEAGAHIGKLVLEVASATR
jgi:putative PIG3 family NAD(P)H quinone oxidoreductase